MFLLRVSILSVSTSNCTLPMQPLINLKSFLAVLLILIVPAALLVAYFRNYSTEGAGHEHSEQGRKGAEDMGKGDMSGMKPGVDSSSARGHGEMAQSSAGLSQPPPGKGPRQPDAASAGEQFRTTMPSALPALPGASHLYHVGATGFFLDRPQHITLSIEQQQRLHQIKERSLLDKAIADRKIQEAEQELWKSTASTQPDAADIETKVRQIEKLRADRRLAFIRSVGETAKVLTKEQTTILLGTAAPVMADMPAAKPAPQPKLNTSDAETPHHPPGKK
jgi:Spy/CpxP family protein refolding chaperone